MTYISSSGDAHVAAPLLAAAAPHRDKRIIKPYCLLVSGVLVALIQRNG